MAGAGADLGTVEIVKVVLRSVAAGFTLGETALAAAELTLPADGPLLTAMAWAAGEVGVAGVGAVTSCLAFTTALASIGTGLLLSGWIMRLFGERWGWVAEMAAGVTFVFGAITIGTLAGVLPNWVYILSQCIIGLVAYPYRQANEMTAVLSVIFTLLHLSVVFGLMGVISGLFAMGITVSAMCAIRKVLSERRTRSTKGKSSQWSERLLLYSVVVTTMGFTIGLGARGGARGGTETEVTQMLRSVVWVGVLSAGLLGAALGTVAVVCLKPYGAERVAVGAAVTSSAALRLILPACPVIGVAGSVGGLIGGATAAGMSLGAASVASEAEFRTRETTSVVLGSVTVGAVLGSGGLALGTVMLGPTELITVTLVAVGAFILGAPKSPFHTKVNLRGGVLTGPSLMEGIGMEAVTGAVSPLGVGALGAGALATAALGRLGTAGVLVATVVTLGKTLARGK